MSLIYICNSKIYGSRLYYHYSVRYVLNVSLSQHAPSHINLYISVYHVISFILYLIHIECYEGVFVMHGITVDSLALFLNHVSLIATLLLNNILYTLEIMLRQKWYLLFNFIIQLLIIWAVFMYIFPNAYVFMDHLWICCYYLHYVMYSKNLFIWTPVIWFTKCLSRYQEIKISVWRTIHAVSYTHLY